MSMAYASIRKSFSTNVIVQLCGLLFLLSAVVQLQRCYTLGALLMPLGAVWSQNIVSRFLGDCKREIWGKGYILHHDDGPFCWMKPNMEWLSLGTAENGHQSCGPEQRGFIIVCGSHSVTPGVMRNQIEFAEKTTESRSKCSWLHNCWECVKAILSFCFACQ